MDTRGWTGVILAGGRSSRMGRDKALVEYEGRPLIAYAVEVLRPHVDELLIIGDPARYDHIGPLVIADDLAGQGPLGGIMTALRYMWNERMFVLACDMPYVTGAYIEHLRSLSNAEYDAVVAQCDGRLEPLAAIYARRCKNIFAEQLALDARKMSDAIERLHTRYVQVCPGEEGWPVELFRNINTPGDL